MVPLTPGSHLARVSRRAAATWLAAMLVGPGLAGAAQGPQPSTGPTSPLEPAAGMAVARQGHTATVLDDGSILLVGGWADGVGALAGMERYDPATGAVSAAGDLVGPRQGHTATKLPDGSVLVVGGRTDDGVLASAELVTPAAVPLGPSTVTQVGDLIEARSGHVALPVLGDGHVLIVGGSGAAGPATVAELYDPVTRAFTEVPALAGDHAGASAVRLGDAADAAVLVSGGPTGDQLLYDPVSGLARPAASLPASRSHTATLLADGRVLIAGGSASGDGAARGTALIWDPAADAQVADLDLASGPRSGGTASVLSDGRVYIAGGTGADGDPLATAELYDPATGVFQAATSVAGPRLDATVTALGDDTVLVAGGNDGSTTLASLDLLRPVVIPSTMVRSVARACDTAQVFTGRGHGGIPINNKAGSMTTTTVATLKPGDEVTVDRDPVAGASYGSACTGAADYRWYHVRAVNGRRKDGWVAAQVLTGGTKAFPADPPMLTWADPVRVAKPAFDDIAVDAKGVVHAVTAAPTGLVYSTYKSGHWRSQRLTSHADPQDTSRPVYEGGAAIAVEGGTVSIAYERRREDDPRLGDCAPGPCWEHHGLWVSTLRGGKWTSTRVARFGSWPSVAVHDGHTYVVVAEEYLTYLTDASGAWRTERVKGAPQAPNVASIAVDSRGRPHIAIGQITSPSRIDLCPQAGRFVEDGARRGSVESPRGHRRRAEGRREHRLHRRGQPQSWGALLRGLRRPDEFPCPVPARWHLDRPGRARNGLRRVRHRPEGPTERPAVGHAAGVARPATGHLADTQLAATLAARVGLDHGAGQAPVDRGRGRHHVPVLPHP